MRLKALLGCGVAMAMVATAPADATTINLIDLGGVTGSQAEAGFKIAAAYWGSILTNNTTINLGVGFSALGTGIIGSTGSSRNDVSVQTWESRINATKSSSAIDQSIVLPTLTNGGASFITNGTTTTNGVTNDDVSKLIYDAGTSVSAKTLYLNTSVTKALGLNASYASTNTQKLDGSVTFSNTFGFDFNPTDGITTNTFDFIGVAIHEIGHALGFVSGVDFLDEYALGKSPYAGSLGYSLNTTSIYTALDMFRYSNNSSGVAPGTGPTLDLAVGGTKYFSVDGGKTALFGNTFATGAYNGDGSQASHWKDTPNCAIGNGIMDPTFCYGQTGYVTGLDLAAFDAMGWNLSTNALTYANTSTAAIYRQFATAVPEPATWGMMILGFGFVGATMRRRKAKVTTTVRFA